MFKKSQIHLGKLLFINVLGFFCLYDFVQLFCSNPRDFFGNKMKTKNKKKHTLYKYLGNIRKKFNPKRNKRPGHQCTALNNFTKIQHKKHKRGKKNIILTAPRSSHRHQ